MSDIPPFQRRKSRSGTRSRACPKKSDMPRYKFHAKKLTSRTSRSGTRSRACRKRTDMPRYKFHANVEASIPSAPGTQLMMSQSPTTKQCPIMWDTGSIMRLTGATSQIKLLSHIRKKTLVRAWCRPGLQDRSRGAGLAQTEAAEPASLCGTF